MDCDGLYFSEDVEGGALEAALAGWQAQHPHAGAMLLVAEADRQQIPQLQALSRKLELPIIGGVFPGLIWRGQLYQRGVLAMCFPQMPDYCLLSGLSREASFSQVVNALEQLVESSAAPQNTLLLLFDALFPRVTSLLDKLYLILANDVHYLGANAGSESFQPIACLFNQDEFIDDALLAVLLPEHAGGKLQHGYRVPDSFRAATASVCNRISSIDWRPAFEVYTELAREHYDVDINRDNFYQYGAHFPFGILRADGEVLVRIPVALEEDGSVYCVGEVPENAVLTLLQAVEPGSQQTVEQLANAASSASQSAALLTFYCAGRRMHLGEAAEQELADLQTRVGLRPVVGALSLGEIGNARSGYPLFHNATLVTSDWV